MNFYLYMFLRHLFKHNTQYIIELDSFNTISFCDEFRQNCDEIAVFVTKIVYLGRNPEIL